MKAFMGLSVFVLGLISIILGLIIIARDKLVASGGVSIMAEGGGTPQKDSTLKLVTDLLNAIANLCEKLFGQFVSKERLPVFLILIGIIMCVLGKWLAG